MGKKTFTEAQIASALRQAEAGTSVLEICRKLGVTEQTCTREYPAGNANLLVSVWLSCVAYGNWKKKTTNSSNSWRI
jgi:predicted transcriptional regulator